jgi:hypothetical protein
MSAMPARVTELSNGPDAPPVSTRTQRRVERREAQKAVRRDRRRWAFLSCGILAAAFGSTVLILGVLH